MDVQKAQENGRPRRLSVRLDPARAVLLYRLSQRTGRDTSHLVRAALDRYATSVSQEVAASSPRLAPAAAASSSSAPAVRPSPKLACTLQVTAQATATVKTEPPGTTQGSNARRDLGNVSSLLPQYRAFGAELWPERRRLFQRLYCVALLAYESSDNPRDHELYDELLRIGRAYGLFN